MSAGRGRPRACNREQRGSAGDGVRAISWTAGDRSCGALQVVVLALDLLRMRGNAAELSSFLLPAVKDDRGLISLKQHRFSLLRFWERENSVSLR